MLHQEISSPTKQNQNFLFPPNYYDEIVAIYEQLPEKHAEKQVEIAQHELSLKLLANTAYIHFYQIFFELNREYGPDGDYAKNYLGNLLYIRCRYPTIFTRRQEEFSGGVPLNINLQNSKYQHGDICPGVYPAVKIPLFEEREDQFIVLGEGPYVHTFPVLLDRLREQRINVLIAVGPPNENQKEKYFNYMSMGEVISAEEYLLSTTAIKDVPIAFKNINDQSLSLKFYRYVCPRNKDIFYIMHIPNWKDLGLPILTEKDKQILAYDIQYGGNRFYHCSAGVGRSVALVVMRMAYELIFKKQLGLTEAVSQFENILKRIKEVKPRAGEWCQLLLALGIAQEIHAFMSYQFAKNGKTLKSVSSVPLNQSLFKTNLSFFKKLENRYLEENKQRDPILQHAYDHRFGLVPYKK